MTAQTPSGLRGHLENSERFQKLLDYFVQQSSRAEIDAHPDPEFEKFYSSYVKLFADDTRESIERLAASPIERIFLNSLLLGFTKNDPLGLVIHRTYTDTPKEIDEFLQNLSHFREFIEWYGAKYGNFKDIQAYLTDQVASGAMSTWEHGFICGLMLHYFYLDSSSTFHLTIQPRFRDPRLGKRAIKPDLLFWIPAAPNFRIVIECDGFAYHSTKEAFTRDRKRDRVLTSMGYEVLRFSGTEIFHDPIAVSTELATHLYERRKEYFPECDQAK